MPSITKKRTPPSAYQVIAQKSLFSPDRSEYLPNRRSEDPAKPTPTRLKGKVTLFGIIIEEGKRSALIKAPVNSEDEKPIRWVREGDAVVNYILSAIEADKIILTDGKQNYQVELYGADKLKDQPAYASKKTEKDAKPTVITSKKTPSKTTSTTSKSTITPDGKYKIVETPFGKSRIRIKK
ncbi:MAG: hypothetical protein JRH15_20875 [Deltaproteobacteria bacterium]|nr:hypothetical protein [Deltaproteobacteria bacterium]